jgi:hypothetical protein
VTARNLQRLFSAVVATGLVLVVANFSINYMMLQRHLDRVIARDARNAGIRVTAYYDSYLTFDTIVFDVRAVGPPGGPPALLRSFLQFGRELQGRNVSEVVIAYRGQRKFKIHGDDFLGLGALVGATQPRQLLWELAHNLRFLNNKLVMSNLPGNYAALLKKALGEGSETKAAEQLFQTMTH